MISTYMLLNTRMYSVIAYSHDACPVNHLSDNIEWGPLEEGSMYIANIF